MPRRYRVCIEPGGFLHRCVSVARQIHCNTNRREPGRPAPVDCSQRNAEELDTMDHVDHVLIVDDDREIRELVGNYLKKNGLRTTVVADGRQMRAFLETTPVDLIVLDIMMPGDDGLVLCRE